MDNVLIDTVLEEVTGPLGDQWGPMTFPTHRHLLGRLGKDAPDARGAYPVARCARVGERPVGLLIAEVTAGTPPSAELISLFVVPELRGQGLASGLLAGLEADLARRGIGRVTGVYMTGKPTLPALERVFAKNGFSPPEVRKVVVKFTPEEATRTEWYAKAKLPPDCEIFRWADLTPAEREALQRSQAEQGWIHPELEPWRSDARFDEVSSVGLRKGGQVVGWVINHRMGPDLVAFTTSFVRSDLARRGAIFPLYVNSLERLRGTGVLCTFVTDAQQFPAMVRFVLRRCASFVTFCGETRGVFKELSSGSPEPANSAVDSLEFYLDFDDRDRWNAFVAASPFGHFFQSWEWGDLQVGLGARPRRIAALSDGRLVGCVQTLVFGSDERKFAYVPRGPVSDPDEVSVTGGLLDAAIAMSASEGTFLLRMEPQWALNAEHVGLMEQKGFGIAKQRIMPLRTILVDLQPSLEDIWAGFHSNTRNRIRLAEKRGVEVVVGREDDMPAFATLFEETQTRHGLRRADPAAFPLSAELFGRQDAMRLYLARSEGKVLSGIVVFLWGTMATYLWGASSGTEEARKLNPNQLLHWTAMQWAKSRGCTTYDLFGIPDYDVEVLEAEYSRQTGGMWNLYRFKRGFGGTVHRHLGTFDCKFQRS
jgi:lipid II:glycine glycyltransferase (peptidoglycan interpeptide bridge formation enzyme)/GNAT superfamily N-acetyltransferase